MRRVYFLLLCVALLIFLAPSVRADQWDKRTEVTVAETIQVPGTVLAPGVYVFKLLDSPSNRHIVQVFNGDGTELLTTILAIPNYRLEPTGKTAITFWEMPPGQPRAVRAWFYPGDNFGQEFAYPRTTAVTIARVDRAEVPSVEAVPEPELETAPVITVEPPPEPTVVAEVPAIAPPALPEPAINEADRQVVTPELPKTATPYPLIGLAGILCLVLFFGLRAFRFR